MSVSKLALGSAVLVVALLATLVGVGRGPRAVPLETGRYVTDELNTEAALHGVSLELDLGRNTVTLRDGAVTVRLALDRIEDRDRWQADCGTMTGHSVLETAELRPTRFTLRGRPFEFRWLTSACVYGVELHGPRWDEQWFFRPQDHTRWDGV